MDKAEKRPTSSVRRVAVAIIRDGDLVLVGRRAPGQSWAGYLEFPGGHVQEGESWNEAARRETREETGLDVEVGPLLEEVRVTYARGSLEIRFFSATVTPGASRTPRTPFFWMKLEDLRAEEFPPANAGVIAKIQAEHSTDRC